MRHPVSRIIDAARSVAENTRNATLRSTLVDWVENIQWAEKYAGQSRGPNRGICIADWNDITARAPDGSWSLVLSDLPSRVERAFTRAGCDVDWPDSTTTCDGCNGLIKTDGTYTIMYEGRAPYYCGEDLKPYVGHHVGGILCPQCARDDAPLAFARADIGKEYDVNERGIVTSPGKFEGEPAYTVYFWQRGLEGCASEDIDTVDGPVWMFEVTREERHAFPELGDRKELYLAETDNGFVFECDVTKVRDAEAALGDCDNV